MLYLTTYVSQGSAATDLRGGGGSFKSTLLRRLFLTLSVKKITKIGPRLPTFCHLALGGPVIMVYRANDLSWRRLALFECCIVSNSGVNLKRKVGRGLGSDYWPRSGLLLASGVCGATRPPNEL